MKFFNVRGFALRLKGCIILPAAGAEHLPAHTSSEFRVQLVSEAKRSTTDRRQTLSVGPELIGFYFRFKQLIAQYKSVKELAAGIKVDGMLLALKFSTTT